MARLKYKYNAEEKTREVDTKLGKVSLNLSAAICFPHGIVGFSNKHHYCLAEIPEGKLAGALLLQSLEEDRLGFIVLPLAEKFYSGDQNLLLAEDVLEACNLYNIKSEDLDLLVIATLSKIDNKFKISINLKAPILMDRKEKIAYQHVFIRHDYPLTYFLT